ncbi:MerR family transcriptional regulator [Enterococcus sp.]|uniref:MerR family transcriptional regulator n=1 Tax=Enterococcus sp. TaxID=35783 RepID=UPI003C796344
MTSIAKTYTIRDVSQRFGLPASTLRYYEEVGLLKDIRRNGKHRLYEDKHLGRLGAIQCFKQTGMSISQIQEFFYHEDVTEDYEALVDLLAQQSAAIETQLQQLLENQRHITAKLAFYSAKKAARQQGLPEPCWDDFD